MFDERGPADLEVKRLLRPHVWHEGTQEVGTSLHLCVSWSLPLRRGVLLLCATGSNHHSHLLAHVSTQARTLGRSTERSKALVRLVLPRSGVFLVALVVMVSVMSTACARALTPQRRAHTGSMRHKNAHCVPA